MNTIPYGYCHCGCSGKTNIAKRTISANGVYKGRPFRFIQGHNRTTSQQQIESLLAKAADHRSKWQEERPDIPYGYCQCGCGQKTNPARQTRTKWGHVKGQPLQFIYDHHFRNNSPQYIVDPDTGCWVWQWSTNGRGYGYIHHNGKHIAAYRYFYEKYKGGIPDRYHVHHICNNTLCVNPEHLMALSETEHARLRPNVKLSVAKAEEIRHLLKEGHTAASLARRFGVTAPAISAVKRGINWS